MAIPKKTKPSKCRSVAVIDLGSNSVRLVIYERHGKSYRSVKDYKARCQLALGMMHDDPKLNPQGMVLALKALREFKSIIKKRRVDRVLAIATAAMRAVAHTRQGKMFHQQTEHALGYKIKIISGRQEARLTAYGVLSALPKAVGICGDLGGGSLELARINRGQVLHTSTLTLGTLTLLNEAQNDIARAGPIIHTQLQKIRWLTDTEGQTFYAIGGSWRAVGRVIMKQLGMVPRPIHGFTIKAAVAKEHACAIAEKKPACFKKMSPKISHRADVIPIAAAALAQLIERINPRTITFSGHGVREGLVGLE